MKQFFEFDRRKKEDMVHQVVTQFIAYVNDYKLITGTPIPDLNLMKKELAISEKEIQKIIAELIKQGYLVYNEKEKRNEVHSPSYLYDFLINVAPAYREILNSGKKAAVVTLEKKEVVINAEMAVTFQMPIGERVLYYRRYLTADGAPMFYIEFCLNMKLLPDVKGLFEDHEPHLEFLMKKFASQYKYHVRELSVVTAPPAMIDLLVPNEQGMICTLGKYKFFTGNGEIVESGFAYMTDLTEFTTTSSDLTELLI